MRQFTLTLLAVLAAGAIDGCDRSKAGAAATSQPAAGGIVSLTPAGTDLLVAMGLTDRIVGISPYDANDALRRKLPKVGDYQRIDWERLGELRPGYLLVQGRLDRMPAGVRERCNMLGIVPVILQIDRLSDVRQSLLLIGKTLHETDAAARAARAFDVRADALKAATPAVSKPTLILFSDDAPGRVIGRDTFVDDALALAGGRNVVETDGYATLDREKLASLRPEAVFVLLPGATREAAARAKAAALAVYPQAAVVPLTADDTLMPGTCALKLAETMAATLKARQ